MTKETKAEGGQEGQNGGIAIGTGALVMFPSELQHMVEQKQGRNLRTSLSFNTFIKGDIGVNGELTELRL